MTDYSISLKNKLLSLEKNLGGDIGFIGTANEGLVKKFEGDIGWQLPDIFFYFYSQESNGIIIDNKRIYSIFDPKQKKTWVENLERMNNPEMSPWFKKRPHIFDDYLVVGSDGGVIFCLSKKYDLPNPSLYICKNPDDPKGVSLDKLSLDLESLISEMVKQAYDTIYHTR